MRIRFALTILFGAALVWPSSSAQSARQCVTVECWTAECWAIPGGRRCRRVCRNRCWDDTPRYQPPVYAEPAPVYPAPSYASHGGPPPEAVLAVLAGLVGLVIIGIVAVATSTTPEQEIAADTAATDELIGKLAEDARKADAHISALLEKERRRGGPDV